MMKWNDFKPGRRLLLQRSATLGIAAIIPATLAAQATLLPHKAIAAHPLVPPAQGPITVAFVISKDAEVIDFCGPWEVFQDVSIPGRDDDVFQLYTVAETTEPIRATGGLQIIPDYSFDTAPPPKLIVIPAQAGATKAMLDWIRQASHTADLTASICTGAFVLARTGLLADKRVTTHHSSYAQLAMEHPDVVVKRGVRFVEDGNIASSGGLSCGIDLALRIVERYFGRAAALRTAYSLEYLSEGWLHPETNAIYAKQRLSTTGHPLCPVCFMDVDTASAPTSVYKGKHYYFCMPAHKDLFDANPGKYIA